MRKFIICFLMAFAMIFSANAQVATENAKILDNTYARIEVGGAVPFVKFDNMFPMNTLVGVSVGKQFTPIFGAEVEGTAWFGSHVSGTAGLRFGQNENGNYNFVRGTYVGVNWTTNLTNLFAGYKGSPRLFEVSTVLGTGWTHVYTPNVNDASHNGFGIKTGLDLAFNLGKEKQHSINIRPAVLWDATGAVGTMPLQFNRKYAELNLSVGYTYHFKTSNGTRHFKVHNVGALTSEIDILNTELAKKPKYVERVVTKVVKETAAPVVVNTKEVVFFAFDSATLDDVAKATLDSLDTDGVVYDIYGYASCEGKDEYNKALSLRRAQAVAEYLTNRGAKTNVVEGLGVANGESTGRVAVVLRKH